MKFRAGSNEGAGNARALNAVAELTSELLPGKMQFLLPKELRGSEGSLQPMAPAKFPRQIKIVPDGQNSSRQPNSYSLKGHGNESKKSPANRDLLQPP